MGLESNLVMGSFKYRATCDRCGKQSAWYPNVAGIAQDGFAVDTMDGYGYRGMFCRNCRMRP